MRSYSNNKRLKKISNKVQSMEFIFSMESLESFRAWDTTYSLFQLDDLNELFLKAKKDFEAFKPLNKPDSDRRTMNQHLEALSSIENLILSNNLVLEAIKEQFDINKDKKEKNPEDTKQLRALSKKTTYITAKDSRKPIKDLQKKHDISTDKYEDEFGLGTDEHDSIVSIIETIPEPVRPTYEDQSKPKKTWLETIIDRDDGRSISSIDF